MILIKTYMEYSLATTDDLIKFWRSKVRAAPWFKYVAVKASTSMLGIVVFLVHSSF